jgi:hypothetical protein
LRVLHRREGMVAAGRLSHRPLARLSVNRKGFSGFRCDSFNPEPAATAEDRDLRRRWLRVKRAKRSVCTYTRKSHRKAASTRGWHAFKRPRKARRSGKTPNGRELARVIQVGWVKLAQAYGGSSQTDQPSVSAVSRSDNLISEQRPTKKSPTKLRLVPVDATLQFMNKPH